MTQESQQEEVVISYTVDSEGVAEGSQKEYARIAEFLGKGYKVVDILTAPANAGGASAGLGFVCITVLLTSATRKYTNPYITCHRGAD